LGVDFGDCYFSKMAAIVLVYDLFVRVHVLYAFYEYCH
jgi:hypothetical protein